MANQEPKFSTLPGSDAQGANEGYGKLLTDAREAKGLTVEQVASQLRLSPKQVAQMEAEDLSAFPTPVYARAHVRSYARLIGLDADKIVKMMNEQHGLANRSSVPDIPVEPREPKTPARGRFLVGLFFLALLGGVGYIGYDYYEAYLKELFLNEKTEVTVVEETAVPAKTVEVAPTPAAPAAEAPAPGEAKTPEAEPAAPAPAAKAEEPSVPAAAAVPAESEKVELSPAVPQPEPAPAPAPVENSRLSTNINEHNAVVVEVPDDGMEETKLTFAIPQGSGRSWIGVYNAQGKLVFSKTLDSGSVEQVSSSLPMRVTFGNTNAVDVTVNGRPLDYRENLSKVGTRHFVAVKQDKDAEGSAASKVLPPVKHKSSSGSSSGTSNSGTESTGTQN